MPHVRGHYEGWPCRNARAAAVADMQIRCDLRDVQSISPHSTRIGERAQDQSRRSTRDAERRRGPAKLRVRERDALADIPILWNSANRCGATEYLVITEGALHAEDLRNGGIAVHGLHHHALGERD